GDDPDLAGLSRVRDSDGNGSAVRDIGAYEYQRLAPTAVIANPFDAGQSSDPDGDPLRFDWSFGDGTSGTGVTASHVFGAPGTYLRKVRVRDPTGLSGTATRSTAVAPAAGRAAAPVLGKLSKRILRKHGRPIGTLLKFKLDQPATVRLVFKRKGHKAR